MNKRITILLLFLAFWTFQLGLEIGNDRADELEIERNWMQIKHQGELHDYWYAWKQCDDQLPKGETE